METKKKLPLILIVDDSAYNRDLLTEIIQDSFRIIEASNGSTAITIMEQRKSELACVLLDLTMANMNGFQVMQIMNERNWIKSLPVIVISAEYSPDAIRRSYTLGASDYILRPFDEIVVKKRINNIVGLYENQKKLAGMVIEQIHENDRLSDMMISILGHTVEFRNKESNDHIENVSLLTKIFLEYINEKSDKYNFSKKEIALISRAAALHDLGKVSIPDEILNKPGKLTPEEFEFMKKHTVIGSQMLESTGIYKDEPLVKLAYKICLWHHERYDGRGYPNGLKGDDIPIEAQVVALADVFDALTSERCYKKAFTHEEAIRMISNDECGVFNSLLVKCIKEIGPNLKTRLMEEVRLKNQYMIRDMESVS
ncbi:MAG: response regulator [Treponema sp.]|nr:response regulator [Candidatus Treponema merdequi]